MPRLRVSLVAGGLIVAAGVAILWIVLSLWTRLIFHLMPAAPSLGAAFAFRWRTSVGQANGSAITQSKSGVDRPA